MNLVLFLQESAILRSVYNKISHIVRIIPYYLMKECLLDEGELNVKPGLQSLEIEVLSLSEIVALAGHPEVLEDEDELRQRYQDGCLCLGLKQFDAIVAYTWCDLRYFQLKQVKYELKENEAYLFDMRTFKAYRGKNLAPYLRYQLYTYLSQRGYSVFYSISALFHTSSQKFKMKLGAKREKFYLYVSIFDRFTLNIPLKTYRE